MAFLNKQERDALLDELRDKDFGQIRTTINRKDTKTRLAYFRNVQETGKWMTRYILPGLGTQVTLIERIVDKETLKRPERDYELVEIIVEPTSENRL